MKIIDGEIYGYVRTDKMDSECEFVICSVEIWKEMTEEQAEKYARDALFESGMMEWGW